MIVLFLDTHNKLVLKDSRVVESFDNYTIKRKGILSQLKLPQKHVDKVQRLFVLQYLVECYLGQSLSEKTMNSYLWYFNEQHVKVIETILRNPDNLRTIISALTSQNGDFVQFMLECLFVAENNPGLNKAILDVFSKCNADKFLVRKISLTEFKEPTADELSFCQPKLCTEKARLLNLTLHLFGQTLNKTNPVSMTHFFCDSGAQENSKALIRTLLKLMCQSKFRNLAVSAENILDQVLGNFKLKSVGKFDEYAVIRGKSHLVRQVVSFCLEMHLLKSKFFLKVVNLFLKHEIEEFVVFLANKIDLFSVFQGDESFRGFSKVELCIIYTLFNRMIQFHLITERHLPQFRVCVSGLNTSKVKRPRRNNLLSSSILALERSYTAKFGADYLNDQA